MIPDRMLTPEVARSIVLDHIAPLGPERVALLAAPARDELARYQVKREERRLGLYRRRAHLGHPRIRGSGTLMHLGVYGPGMD